MKRYSKKNLRNIQTIVQEQTGVFLTVKRKQIGHRTHFAALAAACLLCLITLSAFTYAKLSDLDGDKVGFGAVYQGEGRFEIVVMNASDRVLKLQDKVKVMQWSTSREVEGDPEKIKMSGLTIEPHSQGIVSVDLSEGYDVEAMANNLQEGDWYYFVLTNNYFAFGQDWMCSFDMEVGQTQEVADRVADRLEELSQQEAEGQAGTEPNAGEDSGVCQQAGADDLRDSDWIWPTVSHTVSAAYGEQGNGRFSDHMNIKGTAGDEVYAVADGTVVMTGFDSTYGNVLVLDLGEGVTVKYGHLKEINVSEGDGVSGGQVIGTVGKSGMATGVNLLFAVYIDGEAVNPVSVD